MEVDPFQLLGVQPGCDFAAITAAHAERCRQHPELRALYDQALLELISAPKAHVTSLDKEEKAPAPSPPEVSVPVLAAPLLLEPLPVREKVIRIEPLPAEPLHDVEAIPGRNRFVDDEDGGGAKFGGLVILVGSASVVRHCVAAEDRGVQGVGLRRIERNGRVIHQHDQRLAFHVQAFEIVPLKLGRLNAVAGENHF